MTLRFGATKADQTGERTSEKNVCMPIHFFQKFVLFFNLIWVRGDIGTHTNRKFAFAESASVDGPSFKKIVICFQKKMVMHWLGGPELNSNLTLMSLSCRSCISTDGKTFWKIKTAILHHLNE